MEVKEAKRLLPTLTCALAEKPAPAEDYDDEDESD